MIANDRRLKKQQKILEQALLKAHKNGWKPLYKDWKNVEIQQWQGGGMVGIALLYNERESAVHWVRELEGIIFNHDFAKALWGEEERVSPFEAGQRGIKVGGKFDRGGMNIFEIIANKGWKRHLQDMVIAEDPLEYLGENLD